MNNRAVTVNKNNKLYIESQYNSGRSNLLLMLILTGVNIVLVLAEADLMFLFTAMLPYAATLLAPYGGLLGIIDEVPCIIAYAVLPVVAWLACWLLSKNNRIWMVIATVLFALDSVYLVSFIMEYGFETSLLLNIVFHVYLLFVFIRACIAGNKLAKGDYMQDEVPAAPVAASPVAAAPAAEATVADPAEQTVEL